ncbi:unnamed protein product [Dovyalis caffra]|uniref:Exostosin GT47 domain-containing protein n=1 Tax=Dovyalis caffra TaxID=77055 RepID=A0AAV1SNX9_9ROSI|nr:unnamed protein product [Dovyalis caffra]
MDMEKNFKIFVYPYTDKAFADDKRRKLSGKYGSEGYFFESLQQSHFLTTDPDKAPLFFVPISCHKLRREGRSYEDIAIAFQDYVKSLIAKNPYWNRTRSRSFLRNLYNVQYVPRKDVPLPQIIQPFALPAGGNNLKNRTLLAFWAGRCSSDIRDKMIQAWQNDTELDIQNEQIDIQNIRGHIAYQEKLQVSFLRLSAVILSDYSVLPFNDILDWRNFSVILKEKDVHRLKKILKRIPDQEYRILQDNTVKVQQHFQWNSPPVKLDAFHPVLYELWLCRHVVKYERVDTGMNR